MNREEREIARKKAKKKYRLSTKHVSIAKELGLNPKKMGKIAPNKSEPWKDSVAEFIERLHE